MQPPKQTRQRRTPTTFLLKEVLTALALVATVAVAWGFGSARISFIERDYIDLKGKMELHVATDQQKEKELLQKLDEIRNGTQRDNIREIEQFNELGKRLRELEFMIKNKK